MVTNAEILQEILKGNVEHLTSKYISISNVNYCDDQGVTFLAAAVKVGKLDAVKRLLELGSKPDYVPTFYSLSPLRWAVVKGHEAIVKILLASKANPNILDRNHSTLLMIAAFYLKPKIVNLLLDEGVDHKVINRDKNTALSIAVDKTFRSYFEAINNIFEHCSEELRSKDVYEAGTVFLHNVAMVNRLLLCVEPRMNHKNNSEKTIFSNLVKGVATHLAYLDMRYSDYNEVVCDQHREVVINGFNVLAQRFLADNDYVKHNSFLPTDLDFIKKCIHYNGQERREERENRKIKQATKEAREGQEAARKEDREVQEFQNIAWKEAKKAAKQAAKQVAIEQQKVRAIEIQKAKAIIQETKGSQQIAKQLAAKKRKDEAAAKKMAQKKQKVKKIGKAIVCDREEEDNFQGNLEGSCDESNMYSFDECEVEAAKKMAQKKQKVKETGKAIACDHEEGNNFQRSLAESCDGNNGYSFDECKVEIDNEFGSMKCLPSEMVELALEGNPLPTFYAMHAVALGDVSQMSKNEGNVKKHNKKRSVSVTDDSRNRLEKKPRISNPSCQFNR